ncbi:HAD domain-containing protein [Magnetospirillum sp. 15-1]|uniref:HAD domain-containing protein n=1 Tax=Magnetospirillum sp. 15-1 TaxID=1979370 RepID=UPI000BBBD945|nr:HAD domain-containing protein [Magnetospirillum sp. 15-1]
MFRIIFLDIDGVILPLGAEQFDLAAIECINAIARQARAEIVVASSWRRHVGPIETIDALLAAGLAKPLCCLPETSEFSTKAEDVAAWLGGHAEVEAWVLIDDGQAVCRSVRALKDRRGLVVEVGAGGFGQGALKRALRHLCGHQAISIEDMPPEFVSAFQHPYESSEQAALDHLLDEEGSKP